MRRILTDRSLGFRIDFHLAPEALWPLLTDNAHIARWWGGHATLEAVPGGVFRETWSKDGRVVVTAGTMLEVSPPHRLSMTWADDDWPGFTRLDLNISARGNGGSNLELTHAGWEVHAQERRKQLIADHADVITHPPCDVVHSLTPWGYGTH